MLSSSLNLNTIVTKSRNCRNLLVVLLLGKLLELLLIVSHHVSYAFYGCKGQVVLLLIIVRGRFIIIDCCS